MAPVNLSHSLLTDPRVSNDAVADLVSAAVDTAGFDAVPASAVVSEDGGDARTVLVRDIADREVSLSIGPARAPVLVVVLDGRVETVPGTGRGVGHELLGQGQIRLVPAAVSPCGSRSRAPRRGSARCGSGRCPRGRI